MKRLKISITLILFRIGVAILYCLLFSNGNCQKEGYNWTFPDSSGLSFRQSGDPEYVKHNGSGYEANAAISDTAGNLLFYLSRYKGQVNYIVCIRDKLGNIIRGGIHYN